MSYWPIEGVDFLLRIWGPPSQKNRPTMLVAMAVEQRCALEKMPFFLHVTKGDQLWRHDPSTLRSADDIDVTGRTSRMHSGGGVRCPRGFRFTAKQIDPNGRHGFSSRQQIDSYLLEIEVGISKFYGYWVRAFHYFCFKDELCSMLGRVDQLLQRLWLSYCLSMLWLAQEFMAKSSILDILSSFHALQLSAFILSV